MREYATVAQLWAWPGRPDPAPEDAALHVMLRQASRAVDVLLAGRVYPVDAAGMPTAPADAQAMADAVCAIVTEGCATETFTAGSTTAWSQVSIAGVSLGGRTTAEGATVVAGLPIPASALLALQDVGRPGVAVVG